MKLAVFNWSNRLAGGAETYLGNVLPALAARPGFDLALLHEIDAPTDRLRLPRLEGMPTWNVAAMGLARALDGLRAWGPDLIYAHVSHDPAVEAAVFQRAPTVAFIHNYYGTCISGFKTRTFPQPQPCPRVFGWPCLAQFYPRRCGGLNPVLAWRLFREQGTRLRNLRGCSLLVTHSEWMRREYLRHRFPPAQVRALPFCVVPPSSPPAPPERIHPPAHVVFLGRMDHLKGGHVLLAALPEVCRRLDRRLQVTFAGDGPQRRTWEAQAAALASREPRCAVSFSGWIDAPARERLLSQAHLLVLPSLWPEPFGQVGLEAGFFGVPSVAFAVGGVQAWLEDGLNGWLAPGNPPTARGLAEAIVRALASPDLLRRLGDGARRVAHRFSLDQHMDALLPCLEAAATRPPRS